MVRIGAYACVWLCMHVCTGGPVKMTNYGYTCICVAPGTVCVPWLLFEGLTELTEYCGS